MKTLLPNAILFSAFAMLAVLGLIFAAENGVSLDGEVVAVVSMFVGNVLGLSATLVNQKAGKKDAEDTSD